MDPHPAIVIAPAIVLSDYLMSTFSQFLIDTTDLHRQCVRVCQIILDTGHQLSFMVATSIRQLFKNSCLSRRESFRHDRTPFQSKDNPVHYDSCSPRFVISFEPPDTPRAALPAAGFFLFGSATAPLIISSFLISGLITCLALP